MKKWMLLLAGLMQIVPVTAYAAHHEGGHVQEGAGADAISATKAVKWDGGELHVVLKIAPDGEVAVTLHNAGGEKPGFVTDAKGSIKLDMPGMPMGKSPLKGGKDGKYSGKVEKLMSGAYRASISLLIGGKQVAAVIDFTVK